jgi:hypothetical protein
MSTPFRVIRSAEQLSGPLADTTHRVDGVDD